MNIKFYTVILIFSFLTVLPASAGDDKSKLSKPNVNDHYNYFSGNNILMWISNNGDGSHDPRTDANGFYWPSGKRAINYNWWSYDYKSSIFEDGFIYGAKVNGEIRVNGNTHRQGLQAGKIINGLPDDPSLTKYRVYKIVKNPENLPLNEKTAREKDYNEWPIEDGAPYEDINGDGQPTPGVDKPKLIGDETLWYVANDMDSVRSKFTYGRNPMGVEFQTTVYGFDKGNILGDAVYKKYKLINKGNNQLQDMYVAMWSDADMGDANDDYIGCDTLLDLGYAYNADNNDGIYGINPPAVGYTILKGPVVASSINDSAYFDNAWRTGYRNIHITSSMIYIGAAGYIYRDPQQGVPAGSLEFYNNLSGFAWDGSNIIDPNTRQVVKFVLPGDPVSGTGWYEGQGWPNGPPPADRRLLISCGPFNMSPGDTQEVVFAIHMARGNSNINSVAKLKTQSSLLKQLYYGNFIYANPPETLVVHGVPQDNFVNLWWDKMSENFAVPDILLPDTIVVYLNNTDYKIPVTDKFYRFEGYRIWQFKDDKGSEPKVIAAVDLKNFIHTIYEFPYELVNINGQIPVSPIVSSPDSGIKRYFSIYNDAYTNSRLLNGKDYYFGITSYAYSKFSDPPVLESPPHIIKVTPGIPAINEDVKYNVSDKVYFDHIAGYGDGEVYAKIIDPFLLTGHTYEVSFLDSLLTLLDKTEDDTLITGENYITGDTSSSNITDGFILVTQNTGDKNIGTLNSKIKDVLEIKGPGGANISQRNIFSTLAETNLNSTGRWTITSVNEKQTITGNLQLLAFLRNTGYDDYEIRFTEEGSEYYSSGYKQIGPLLAMDPKAKNRVPFEVWQIPADSSLAPSRLVIKIYDLNSDTSWSKSGDLYESIYTFQPAIPYPDTLPATSSYAMGSTTSKLYRIGNLVIKGELPEAGTVIKIRTWKPLTEKDKFSTVISAPVKSNELAKDNLYKISVFPNPYYAANAVMMDYPGYVRFTNLPDKAVIKIYSLGGVFIKKFEKDSESQYVDWDIKNKDGEFIGSGIYIAHIDIPDAGSKILKIAVVR